MSTRKGSRSLFEVIGTKTRKDVRLPNWMSQGAVGSDAPGESARPAAAIRQSPAPPATGTSASPRPPLAAVIDGRLRLNLSYLTCLIACLGLVVLLVGAYKLGQATAPAGDGEGQGPPKPAGVAGEGGQSEGGHAAGLGVNQDTVEEKAWRRITKGGTFVVIQGNVASYEDAKEIQSYLATKGYLPFIHDSRDGTYRVYDTKDTAGWTSAQINEYIRGLEALGKGRKYSFKHHGDPWRQTIPPAKE